MIHHCSALSLTLHRLHGAVKKAVAKCVPIYLRLEKVFLGLIELTLLQSRPSHFFFCAAMLWKTFSQILSSGKRNIVTSIVVLLVPKLETQHPFIFSEAKISDLRAFGQLSVQPYVQGYVLLVNLVRFTFFLFSAFDEEWRIRPRREKLYRKRATKNATQW